MEEILGYIANIGFPIVITVFLLARIENKLENLSNSIQELSTVIKSKK
ncbi:YvrJ family protein [Miniphocaeibacter halophilus]|uniref:YvrJ family protein n=1 Tax=Miniphocaeibacter halophilus TaxID=2931922 RepID=A0AC61MSD7_9FIRM|nr:YvrJ family protein [Miniphocaeibacter halophilus]QQK08218.1 YvrJ family protein [Miniphocaeibacter halophilus]